MNKSLKSKAERQFVDSQKKAEETLVEKDRAAKERADKRARLKALRLASNSSPEV